MTQQYTCPMHPEIVTNTPGRCPKCGMALVPVIEKPKVTVHGLAIEKVTWKSYLPLIAVVSVIILTTLALSISDAWLEHYSFEKTIEYFMIGFFLTFSLFKLIDLRGFAEGYQTYDLIAIEVPVYGYLYPFIELSFGLGMILFPGSSALLIAEIAVMVISGVGVLRKMLRHEPVVCSCLGTVLKVPLTTVTLVEDFGMALLALVLIFIW
jgi:hypothetical protein